MKMEHEAMGYEGATISEQDDNEKHVRALLRNVQYPGFERNIVSAGFVKAIDAADRRVTIHFAPNTRNQTKIKLMEKDIRAALAGAQCFDHIEIELHRPFADSDALSEGGKELPEGRMANTSGTPDHDIIDPSKQRPDMAPQAGYDEEGPQPMSGPRSNEYEGEVPVFQWEINPQDPDAVSDTANLTVDEWEFRVWWQVHPARLVYASIQAMRSDWAEHGGTARAHPVGRSEAVNLVYDNDRKAVIAIYGTVQDFRPFVDAFYRGYIMKN